MSPTGFGTTSTDADFPLRRARMVDRQLRRRGIRDQRVLAAMATVARERFVPARDGRPGVPRRRAGHRPRPDHLAALDRGADERAAGARRARAGARGGHRVGLRRGRAVPPVRPRGQRGAPARAVRQRRRGAGGRGHPQRRAADRRRLRGRARPRPVRRHLRDRVRGRDRAPAPRWSTSWRPAPRWCARSTATARSIWPSCATASSRASPPCASCRWSRAAREEGALGRRRRAQGARRAARGGVRAAAPGGQRAAQGAPRPRREPGAGRHPRGARGDGAGGRARCASSATCATGTRWPASACSRP